MYMLIRIHKSIFNYILFFFFIKKLIKYAKGQKLIMKWTSHTLIIIMLRSFWNRIIKATFLAKSLKDSTNALMASTPRESKKPTCFIKQTVLSVSTLSHVTTQKLPGQPACRHGRKTAGSGTAITVASRAHTEPSQVPQGICWGW